METAKCYVCGAALKMGGSKKPYLGCPNGCAQVMIRKNIDQFEAKYGKDWRKGGSAGAPPPTKATSTTSEKEPDRAPTRGKTLDEEFES